MKSQLQEKLVKKYPSLCREWNGDPMKTCMAWGFEVPDEYYDYLDVLFGIMSRRGCWSRNVLERTPFYIKVLQMCIKAIDKQLYKIYKRNPLTTFCSKRSLLKRIIQRKYLRVDEEKLYVVLDQVKTKFGSLRVYYTIYNEYTPKELKQFDKDEFNEFQRNIARQIDGAIGYTENITYRQIESKLRNTNKM